MKESAITNLAYKCGILPLTAILNEVNDIAIKTANEKNNAGLICRICWHTSSR